jgi:hypothetical protein
MKKKFHNLLKFITAIKSLLRRTYIGDSSATADSNFYPKVICELIITIARYGHFSAAIKLFSSSVMLRQNTLECLSLANTLSRVLHLQLKQEPTGVGLFMVPSS